MAPTVEEELTWFRQLGSLFANGVRSGKHESMGTHKSVDSAADADKHQWESFDMADMMEQGMAQEVIASFVTPPPSGLPSMHLVVSHSPDGSRQALHTEEGETLLVAETAEDGSINMYVPAGGDPPRAAGAAFTLTAGAQEDGIRTWTLFTDRCACYEYSSEPCRRELARISHCRENFRECSFMSMEVELPPTLASGTPAVWCQKAGRPESEEPVCMESRRPKWNQRLQALTLDFRGRATEASVQNIQLDLAAADGAKGQTDGEPDFLYGKVGDDTFVLDYKYPLSMAQAFALALTTNDWH